MSVRHLTTAELEAGLEEIRRSPIGRRLNLRGINARVVQPGAIRTGDAVRKVAT